MNPNNVFIKLTYLDGRVFSYRRRQGVWVEQDPQMRIRALTADSVLTIVASQFQKHMKDRATVEVHYAPRA